MAVKQVERRICDFCDKEAALDPCEICGKDFCYDHGDRYSPMDRGNTGRPRFAVCDHCANDLAAKLAQVIRTAPTAVPNNNWDLRIERGRNQGIGEAEVIAEKIYYRGTTIRPCKYVSLGHRPCEKSLVDGQWVSPEGNLVAGESLGFGDEALRHYKTVEEAKAAIDSARRYKLRLYTIKAWPSHEHPGYPKPLPDSATNDEIDEFLDKAYAYCRRKP